MMNARRNHAAATSDDGQTMLRDACGVAEIAIDEYS
jgi:hypothetical protein